MGSELRNIELSIDYRLWMILLNQGYTYPLVGQTLTLVSGLTVNDESYPANTYAMTNAFPWVFLASNGEISDGGLVVYDNGTIVPISNYIADYKNASLTFNYKPNGPVTVDVQSFACHVREGYPDDIWLKAYELPVVAWEAKISTGVPFGVGSSMQNRTKFCTIDILAPRPGVLSDLMDDVMRYINHFAYFDMSINPPLDQYGTPNINFNSITQNIDLMRLFRKPRGERIAPRIGGLVKERHRGLVTFEVERIS